MADLTPLAHEELCYLTTTGRRSGAAHEIEIWFAFHDGAFFLLAGGQDGADWVLNLRSDAAASLRIDEVEAPVVADEPGKDDPIQAEARHLLREKYAYEGEDLVAWANDSLLVRVRPA
jgi:hypothetical protein